MGKTATVIDRVDVYGLDLTYAHGDYVMSSGRVVNVLPSTIVQLTHAGRSRGVRGELPARGTRTCPHSAMAPALRCENWCRP